MPLNILYHVINDKFFNKSVLPAGIKLTKEKNLEQRSFFLFQLPYIKHAVIGEYTLLNHHVSVYEISLGEVDKKSQYHYTAIFQDKAGKKYRLHIYYDTKDHCLFRPQFCLQKSDNTFDAPMPISLYDEAFNTLANLEIATLITVLREGQKQTLSKLKEKYDALEVDAKALSKKIVENVELIKSKEAYLVTIEAQIHLKKEQLKYDNDWRSVYPQIHVLEKSRHNFSPLPAASATAVVDSDEESTSTMDSKDSKQGSTLNVKEPLKKESSVELKKLKKRFAQYKMAPVDKQPQLLDACYADYLILEAVMTSSNALEQFKCDIEREGKAKLEYSLIIEKDGKYPISNQLSSFYSLVSDSVFNLAIARSATDTSLLTYLLEKKIIPLDYKNCNIKNVSYSSMVAYYFEADITPEAKIKALTLLLRSGVSLMALDNKGLPYAARLFWEVDHPLQDIFKAIPDLGQFYKQFNEVLKVVVSRSQMTPANKAAVEQLIQDNNTRIMQRNHNNTIARLSVLPAADRRVLSANKTGLARKLMAELFRDPDILRIQGEVQEGLKVCVNRAKSSDKKAEVAKICQVDLNRFADALVEVDEKDLPSFSSLKQRFLQQQQSVLKYLSLDSLIIPHAISTIRNSAKRSEQAELRRNQLIQLREHILIPHHKLLGSVAERESNLHASERLALTEIMEKNRKLKEVMDEKKVRLAQITTTMAALEAKVAAQEAQVTAAESESAAVRAEAAAIEVRMAALKAKMTEYEQHQVINPTGAATPIVSIGASQSVFFAAPVKPVDAGTSVSFVPS